MFKNTREIISKTAAEIKFLVSLPGKLEPFILAFSIIYQIYMFVTDKALAPVHLVLLILVTANGIFRMIVGNIYGSSKASVFSKMAQKSEQRGLKRALKIEKKIYNIIKYAIRLFLIVTSVISIVHAPTIIKVVSTMIIFTELVIEITIFAITSIIERRWSKLQTAFYEDLASISEPVKIVKQKAQQVKNTVIDIFGKLFRKKGKNADKVSDTIYIDSEEDAVLPYTEEETV